MNKNMVIDTKKALILDGKRITEYEYDSFAETSKEVILWSNNRVVIYNKETSQKLYEYERNTFKSTNWVFVLDTLVIIDEGDKFFFIKSDGTIKSIKMFDGYEIINSAQGTFLKVTIEGKKGLYDSNAEEVLPVKYDVVNLRKNFVLVRKNDKVGLYNLAGDLLLNVIHNKVSVLNNSIVTCNKERDETLVWTTDCETLIYRGTAFCNVFDNELGTLIENLHDNKYSLYSFDGTPILKDCDYIEVGDDKVAMSIMAKKNHKFGLFDFSGEELLPCEYKNMNFGGMSYYEGGTVSIWDDDDNHGVYSVKERKIVVPLKKYATIISYKDGVSELITEGKMHGYYLVKEDEFVVADDINVTKTGRYEFLINGKWSMYIKGDTKPIIQEEKTVVKELSLAQQKEYADIALNSTDFKDQARAIEKVTDEHLLFKLANDKRIEWKVALDIIENITNQRHLAAIVMNNDIPLAYDHRRATALQEITDQKILKEIFDKVDDSFRRYILDKITDMDFLFNIVKAGCLYPIDRMLKLNREEAIEKLESLNDSSVNFRLWFIKSDL